MQATVRAKKGAAMIALRSGAAVIPVAIIGKYKIFRKMSVVYGKPIDFSGLHSRFFFRCPWNVTDAIMAKFVRW